MCAAYFCSNHRLGLVSKHIQQNTQHQSTKEHKYIICCANELHLHVEQ